MRLRVMVIARARESCEYCLVHADYVAFIHEIDQKIWISSHKDPNRSLLYLSGLRPDFLVRPGRSKTCARCLRTFVDNQPARNIRQRFADKTPVRSSCRRVFDAVAPGNRGRGKKKEQTAAQETEQIVAGLLWDYPPEARRITTRSRPVLRQRLPQLALPRRRVIEALLNA